MNAFLMSKVWSIIMAIPVILMLAGTAKGQDIQIIFRGDDFGMTQGSLVAFEKALNEGILCCASIIVPAPWFEGAAELCRKNPEWCTGIHLCLVGEWKGYRWRPVLPYDKAPSLVDEDGYFYPKMNVLLGHQPELSEIDAEWRAQIDLAIKKGVNVQYIDIHCMYADDTPYPGLGDVLKKIGKNYNVPISHLLGEKRLGWVFSTPVTQKIETAVKILSGIQPGLYVAVCHIGIDSPEQNALMHTSPDDIVGKHRAAELDVMLSPEVKSLILKKGIKLMNYKELGKGN